MKEQNQAIERPYCIEKQTKKGPFYMLNSVKMTRLQSRVTFYEGQLDPLHQQNITLKEHLIYLSKLASVSTEILRNLLPISNDPMKKLKLEMANIEQIARMIQLDWKDMEKLIAQQKSSIQRLQQSNLLEIEKFNEQKKKHQQKVQQMQRQREQIESRLETKVKSLRQEAALTKSRYETEKEKMKVELILKEQLIDSTYRELDIFKVEAKERYSDYERCIARINSQIDSNLAEFEQSKKMLKGIWEKFMEEKLQEQAETYELMIKNKEEEKFALSVLIEEIKEDCERKISENEGQIQRLLQLGRISEKSIKKLQDQAYQKKQELMRQRQQNKELQSQTLKLKSKITSLSKQITETEILISRKQAELRQTIQQYQQTITKLKDHSNLAVKKIIEEKIRMEMALQLANQQIETFKAKVMTIEQEWNAKTFVMKGKWLERQAQLAVQIAASNKRYDEQVKKIELLKSDNARFMEKCKKEQELAMRNIENSFNIQKAELIQQFQQKIRQIHYEGEEELVRLKLNYAQEIEREKAKIEQQLKNMENDCAAKLLEKQREYRQLTEKYSQEIVQMKREKELMVQNLGKARKKIVDNEDALEKMHLEQIKAIKKIEQKFELEREKLNKKLQDQMAEFQQELEQRELSMVALKEELEQKINSLVVEFEKKMEEKQKEIGQMRTQMQQEIDLLKESNALDVVEKKFMNQIRDLKAEFYQKHRRMEQTHREQINALLNSNQQQKETIVAAYQFQLTANQQRFRNSLCLIAEDLQDRSIFVNERVESDVKFASLSQEQQVEHIRLKISRIKESRQLMAHRIRQLETSIENQMSQIELRVKERKELIEREKEEFLKQCTRKMDSAIQDCNTRVSMVEKERVRYSQQMYLEFQLMKEEHLKQCASLEGKIKELELLFSDRPSRAEDVSKIKELTNMKTQLDNEIKTYHKKMETANEIVKYLNLELENYKETYDIFGPNELPALQNKTISFQEQPHSLIDTLKSNKLKEDNFKATFKEDRTVSPDVKEFRVFPQKQEGIESLVLESKEVISRSRKYSYIDKNLTIRDKLKTQKTLDKQTEIFCNAESFMKIIKATTKDEAFKQSDKEQYSKKKLYRKRKLKRMNTGVEHYF